MTPLLYDLTDSCYRENLLYFFENSDSCKIAEIDARHIETLFLGFLTMDHNNAIGIAGLIKTKYLKAELLLAVHENYQGKGIATHLLKKLIDEISRRGLSVSLTTYDTPEYRHVISMYQGNGFQRYASFGNKCLFVHRNNTNFFNYRRILIFYFFAIGRRLKLVLSSLQG